MLSSRQTYYLDPELPDFAENLDIDTVFTPVNVQLLMNNLQQSNYDSKEIQFLTSGFQDGFDIGYEGPSDRQDYSRNLPLRVGSETQLWNKLIKEVHAKRVAGPFDKVPFKNFIQSPIGLVPKTGGQTRLIFHLSYNFGEAWEQKSVNFHTPKHRCSVKYQDLDCTARMCLKVREYKLKNINLFIVTDSEGNECIYLSKMDIKSAFRLLPLGRSSYRWMVMKAWNPKMGKYQFFVDKCLPFGASISCSHFQRFSNALKHLIQFRTAMNSVNNYLDDFLFIAATLLLCNYLMQQFLKMCDELGMPIALDKTEWATL